LKIRILVFSSLSFFQDLDFDLFAEFSRHHVSYRDALEPNGPLKEKMVESIPRCSLARTRTATCQIFHAAFGNPEPTREPWNHGSFLGGAFPGEELGAAKYRNIIRRGSGIYPTFFFRFV
jgi:hypothetical protein